MSRPGDIAGDQLRAVVERIETIDEEIKELTEAKKEIYLEAKGNGFDVKILREVIRVRKQDQQERDELETLLEVYLQAIKGASPVAKAVAKAVTKAAAKVQRGRRLSISEAGVPFDRHASKDAPELPIRLEDEAAKERDQMLHRTGLGHYLIFDGVLEPSFRGHRSRVYPRSAFAVRLINQTARQTQKPRQA